MSIFWFFDLETVVRYRYFMEEIKEATSTVDVSRIYHQGRERMKIFDQHSREYVGNRWYTSMFSL